MAANDTWYGPGGARGFLTRSFNEWGNTVGFEKGDEFKGRVGEDLFDDLWESVDPTQRYTIVDRRNIGIEFIRLPNGHIEGTGESGYDIEWRLI